MENLDRREANLGGPTKPCQKRNACKRPHGCLHGAFSGVQYSLLCATNVTDR